MFNIFKKKENKTSLFKDNPKSLMALFDVYDDSVHGDIPTIAASGRLSDIVCVIQNPLFQFNEDLWKSLIDFVKSIAKDTSGNIFVSSTFMDYSKDIKINLDEFLTRWSTLKREDKEPPFFITVKNNQGIPVFCIQTEFWNRIGGPLPFHDSYTYVCFADVGSGYIGRLRQSLSEFYQ